MTGYGSAYETFRSQAASIEIHCEIKTLNSKYTDIQIRAPKSFASFDPDISKSVKSKLRRGRIEIYISRQVLEGNTQEIRVNFAEAEQLFDALCELQRKLNLSNKPGISDLLQHPDWLHTSEIPVDLEEERSFCLQVVERALQKVEESRIQEGKALREVISRHRRELSELFSSISTQSSKILMDLKERSRQRLQEVLGDSHFDPQRLEQEMSLWVARSDFQEEIDRLQHHLETFENLTSAGGEVGRRLEFVVQEMHRELNTMGSKCADVRWTNKIIEMKALVERIREQIQNIE